MFVNFEEVRSRSVHFVDKGNPGYFVPIGLSPDGFRLGLYTTNRAENRHHTIEYPHGTFHFNGEIDVAGGVNDVDAMILPTGTDGGGGDGDSSLPFLFHPVGNCRSVVDFAQFMSDSRVEQDSFCCRCFARVYVSGDSDVSHSL